MACKMVTFFEPGSYGATKWFDGYNVRSIINENTGLGVHMPGFQKFMDIRFHITTNSGSHTGGTLQQAYAEEEYPYLPTNANLIPCIKAIYQMSEYDPVLKAYVDRKPGEWIYDEACRCVSKAQPDGRVNIGDGFVIPNTQEQTDINALMGQSAFTFIQAMQKTCPDIIPPVDALACIEKWLKGSSLRWYDIYRSCRADWIVLQTIITPPITTPPITTPPVTTPPVTLPITSSKNMFLIAGAMILFLAFSKK